MIMTLKQYIKKHGVNYETNKIEKFLVYDINFINLEGENDETQLDAMSIEELDELYKNFCNENNFAKNTVTGITVIDSYKNIPEY